MLELMVVMAGLLASMGLGTLLERRKARRRIGILRALRLGPCYGLDLIEQGLGERGLIYLQLERLEAEGLITSTREREFCHLTGPVYPTYKRRYELTWKGAILADAYAEIDAERGQRAGGPYRRPAR